MCDSSSSKSSFSLAYALRNYRVEITSSLSRVLICSVLLLVGLGSAMAEVSHESHVFFENSPPVPAYYHSECLVVAPSELEIINGKLPLENQRFRSAPNSLRLKWCSRSGGEWRLKIKCQPRYGRKFRFEGDTLSFWCYSDREISAAEAPRINLQDTAQIGSGTTTLLVTLGALPAQQWTQVRIPFTQFKSLYGSTEDFNFVPANLEYIWLTQGLDDGREHALLIDDITVLNGADTDHLAPEPPPVPTLRAFERHFELSWPESSSPDVLRYHLYRSVDGRNFQRVKTQRADRFRMVDFVGKTPRQFFYRLTTEDLIGNESAPSAVVSGQTKRMSDAELLEMVQEATFRYYWDGGHPQAGVAVEILPGDKDLVAVGASGFGIMAMLVGAERQFVTREQCAERLVKILNFLESSDRFHGVWPHFLHGQTGKAFPYFGKYDDGGDLVETAFLVQGLLAARQYFSQPTEIETNIRQRITRLWETVEWDWYRRTPQSEFLYWHWSPNYQWHIGHPLIGWNETLIVYLLAIASPTHAVPASLYHTGWAGRSPEAVAYRRNWSRTYQGDHFTNGLSFYGHRLEVGEGNGSDLFFTQFSFLGFDPRGIRDAYADYFQNNRSIALINRAYCVDNPRKFKGYGPDNWGLSAGLNAGGGRPLPRDDNGTICCSASVGSMPYTPRESLAALKHFYRDLGDRIWTEYGFSDGFNATTEWFEPASMGLNQAVITVMIENYRTGLIWKHFMANPEIAPALKAIGFNSQKQGANLP